ncbi:hypothetical protein I4U23_015361 [Adineta vaga]|nr:hypothetical protein I4U23_015361 [Adineta vaga]
MILDINFDHNWCYSYQTNTSNDSVTGLSAINDYDWTPLELPHTCHTRKSGKYWYRKKFKCLLSDQQLVQSISLNFKSSDNLNPSSISTIIWLNGVQIFSGFLRALQTSIDLPDKLLNLETMEENHHEYTLIVYCIDMCLSFSAFLSVPSDKIFNIREMKFNNNYVNFNANLNNISDDITLLNTADPQAYPETKEHDLRSINSVIVPILSIVMLIVGTRGDVEPFIAYGKALRAVGHRVRLATHEKFRKFVREHDLEFFSLAGDPDEIMSFMVQNSGIFPSASTIIKGNLLRRRHLFADILKSTWSACIDDDDETGVPFQAEVIIANPISYGHIHCAQKLGIPLHMVFTMPYSRTSTFPHPLANVDYSKASRERLNKYSYSLVETLMWLGIGDLINKFRRTILHLPSLHMREVISMMTDEKVPYTYCWSPSLVPKPSDWPFYIDVSGYFFLDLAKNYTSPPTDLLVFLDLHSESKNDKRDKSPPIFIGFGSITGHDSHRLLNIILEALMQTGYRALLSGFDVDSMHLPETILKIDDIPYDWLFQHVAAVCHHGGAGTTAAGLRAGKPTITVPFFGDQFFWANIIEQTGAGASPLPGKHLTTKQLIEAFKFVHKPSTQIAAKRVQDALLREDGCNTAVRSFHANLPLSQMYSDLESTFPACFRLNDFNIQVSRPVAQVLLSAGVVDECQFSYHTTRNWHLTRCHTSKISIQDHPHHDDIQLDTAINKLSVGNFINTSRNNCYRRRTSSNAISTWIADINCAIKPMMNVLLPRNTLVQNTNDHERMTLMFENKIHNNFNSDDISMIIQRAANISGYSPEICKHILSGFNKLKRSNMQWSQYVPMKSFESSTIELKRSQSIDFF